MNVYDFDKTVFRGDSTARLAAYVMLRRPLAMLTLPAMGFGALMYALRIWPKRRFKEKVYGFCRFVPDMDSLVRKFWEKERRRIYGWYVRRKRSDDVIISASSEFALRPICESLGVSLIATPVDRRTGRYLGENCHGAEKVRRFRQLYPNARVDEFYSDSLSDTPMAELAARAYLVHRGQINEWPKKN